MIEWVGIRLLLTCSPIPRVFSLLMNAITLDTKTPGVDRRPLLDVVVQLCHLFETFVICSYPNFNTTDKEEQDVILLKLSHTFVPELDVRHCSPELLDQYLKMLTSAWFFESNQHSEVQLEVRRSAMRVLLACVATDDKEYYVIATLNLQQLIHSHSFPRPELCFLLGHLSRIILEALDNGGDTALV